MKNYISADEFTRLWIDFINQQILSESGWQNWYDHEYKTWTKETIGLPVSEEENSPFGDFIKSKTGLRYRKEDGLVDLTFAPDKNFEGIFSLHEKPKDRSDVLKKDPEKVPFYPRYYSILVEHENDIYKCYEEMAKLTYSRARLKVLITYNENTDDTSDYKYAIDILLENFRTIIKQANQKYPENSETEYLFVIGQIDSDKLVWYSYIFDCNGKLK